MVWPAQEEDGCRLIVLSDLSLIAPTDNCFTRRFFLCGGGRPEIPLSIKNHLFEARAGTRPR
jgi:hypothetical protein